MNISILQWIATALTLVENYAQIRSNGGSAFQANMSTLDVVTQLISHLAQHPATASPAPAPAPVAVATPTMSTPS